MGFYNQVVLLPKVLYYILYVLFALRGILLLFPTCFWRCDKKGSRDKEAIQSYSESLMTTPPRARCCRRSGCRVPKIPKASPAARQPGSPAPVPCFFRPSQRTACQPPRLSCTRVTKHCTPHTHTHTCSCAQVCHTHSGMGMLPRGLQEQLTSKTFWNLLSKGVMGVWASGQPLGHWATGPHP